MSTLHRPPYTDAGDAAGFGPPLIEGGYESVGYDAYALPEKPHWGSMTNIVTGCVIGLMLWALLGWLALG